MSLAAQRHVARLIPTRVRKNFGHSSRYLESRWFSDHSEKEKGALLRALRPSQDSIAKNEKDGLIGSQSGGPAALARDEIKTSLAGEARKRTARPSRNGNKAKKKTTLDDFFANLGSSGSESARSHSPRERSFGKASSNQFGSSETKKVDISSFFDEVNEIMKKNRAGKQETENKPSVKRDIFSLGGDRISTGTSIFDMLPPTKIRGPNAFEEDAFEQYSEMLETIMATPKFLRKHTKKPLEDDQAKSVIEWLQADEPVVSIKLPFLEKAMKEGLSSEEEGKTLELFREDLAKQRTSFMEHHGWDLQQYKVAMGALRNMGNLCAKNATAPPLEIAWQKLKEAGYKMDQGVLYNYLYVSSTFSVRPMSASYLKGGSILDFLGGRTDDNKESEDIGKEEDGAEQSIDVPSEVAWCHDFLFEPSEQSTSIRVRMLVSQGKAKEAERLLDGNSKNDDLRLRTYAPVYQCYLDQGDVSSAFKLYAKMKEGDNVLLQPETYVQLMACIAENGLFRPGAEPIDGVKELGYTEGSGPILFDRLASELAENAVEISPASAKRLYNALQSGFQGHNLKSLHLLESLKTCDDPADSHELVASRVTLDETTGRCPRTGAQLRLINLDAEQKKQLQDGLMYLSATGYEERHPEKKSKGEDELKRFGEWLEGRAGDPFTAIVDGPNVAYYMQNFEQGTFNFHQIKFVVDALENTGENVLVILPKKYTQQSFLVNKSSGSVRQRLSSKEKSIRDDLISSGKAYVVPVGCLDDYYWMYASVSNQSSSMGAKEWYIPPGNPEGRWPGIRPMLVSNDQMRDHKLSLLEPRLFRRWFSNFIVNFTFSAFVGEECVDKEIGFSTADFYSREIQGNAIVDKESGDCGTAWHFPVSDWNENESFCIRIPR